MSAEGEAVRRRRADRGSAMLVWLAVAVLCSGVVVAVFVAFCGRLHTHRVQGAADLVAVTGANVRLLGTGEPCAAAGRAASAADVELVSCREDGNALDFVVTVRVAGTSTLLRGLPGLRVEAQAHAGVRG